MSTRLVIFPTPNPLPPLPPSSPSSSSSSLPSHLSLSCTSSSSSSDNPPSPSLSPSFLSSSYSSFFHPFSHSSPIPPSQHSFSRSSSSSDVSSISLSIFTSPSPPDVVLLYPNPPLFYTTSTVSASASASTSCLPSSSHTPSPLALPANNNRLSTSSSFPSVLPAPTPFHKHTNQHHSHLHPPQTATSATTSTNYGGNPGAIFSVRNVNVDSKEVLSHLPSFPQQTQTQVYTHHHLLDSASGYDRHNQTRRHLQELAQEQYRQNLQVPLNDSDIDDIDGDDGNDQIQGEEFDEAQYRFEALQEPFTQTEYYRHYHRRSRSGRDPVPIPSQRQQQYKRRPVTVDDSSAAPQQQQSQQTQPQEQQYKQQQPEQRQRRTRASTRHRVPLASLLIPPPTLPTTTTSHLHPTQSTSFPTITKTKRTRVPSNRSLGYFSRIIKRLSRLSCTRSPSSRQPSSINKSGISGVPTGSQTSVHLPSQLTVHSIPSSLSTDLSGPIPSIYRHRPQHPGSKRRRQKKAAASAAAATSTGTSGPSNNIKAKNTAPSRREKGKQRAKSRSRAGSLLDVDESRGRYPSTQRHRHHHQHQQHQSSLSISTIHTWCPYCYKTVPSQDQSDHHHRHHLHNLISPTRTPLRIESDSSSPSSSRSSRLHRPRSLSPYPHLSTSLQQQRQQRQRQRSASVDTVRSSILSLTSKKSYLSSDIEVVIPPAAQVTPNTLFTFAHPLPHQQVQIEATTTATEAIATTTGGTALLPALAALTPTTTTTTGAVRQTLSATTAIIAADTKSTFPNLPHKKLSLTLSASTPSSSSVSSCSSSSSRIPFSPSPSPPQHTAPLPLHPHPEFVVFASTPTVSSASSSSSASSPSPSSAVVVVRRSNSARAPQRPHRPQESKLEVSGNRFLFVGALDTPAEQALSALSLAVAASTIAASSSPSSSPPSSPVVNLPVKETPLPPLPSRQPPTTTKRRPLSWAFPSPSSFTFTHPFKNKQKDKHSSTSNPQQSTTATTNFPTGSQQQYQYLHQQQQQQPQAATASGSAPLSPSTPCSPPPPFIQFVRGLETHPWFSDPSTTDRDVNIRDIYPHFGSGGGGASGGIIGGNGGLSNSHSHPKGPSFDDPALFASPGSAKRRSWTTLFPFRSRRSSMPAATLSATSAPSAGTTIIPTSPSTSAVHQHPNYHNHHRYQSQQLYPVPHQQSQQQDQPQKKRSTFKRFSAPAPARKMEVLTIQQQEALLPTMPSTTGGHYPSALEGTGHQQVVGSTGRGRGRVVYDPNKPLPAIVAEGESDEDDGHSSNINNRPASNEPALHSSQGQSRLPPVPPAIVLPTLSLPAAPTPSSSSSSSSSTQPPSSPTASLPVVAEGWSQQQQQHQTAVVVKKHQRRMSFLPSSLMTSNLAKFISGNGSNNNSNNSQTATSPTTGLSTGGTTLTSPSNAAAAAGGGGTNPVGGRQGHGQRGMGGRDGIGGGATTTLNPTSLWSSRSPGPGEGESFQVDGIVHHGRNPLNNTTTSATGTAAAGATNTALTIEQFKWSMICCCNEIKTRVFKQQQQQRQGSLQDDAHYAPPSLGQKSFPDSHNPYSGAAALPPTASSNKKADKNKSRSSNGNGGNNGGNNSGSGSGHLSSANNSCSTSAAIEQAAQESRATLQALLMVMTASSSSSMGMGMDKDRDGLDPTVLASNVQAYRGSSATAGSQLQNQSLLSLIGPGGGVSMSATGAAPPMRSHSSHHLSRYSSHSLLLTGPTTTPGGQPSAGGAPTTPLRTNKSQSGMANSYAQATNAILNPLSLQDLALLLAYLLSIAPDQWIPWHLYDFFVRPQGRSYKDLIEMLPTHSQRILKALLETVEALIDYATVTGLQYQRALFQQQQQQSGPAGKQPTLAHLRSRSEVDPGHSRNNGGYGAGANPMLRSAGSSTLSLARALAILEPPFSAQELQQLQQQQQMKQQQAGLHPAARGGDTVHQEIAMQGRKRRVILDSLSGLVFRPRVNESLRGDGGAGGAVGAMGVMNESPNEGGGGGLLSPEEKGNGGKGKAMRRRSFLGAATSITPSGSSAAAAGGPSPAAVALQLQMSEHEREAGHLAFENLVSAFETEFVRPLPSVVTGSGTDPKAPATTTVGGVEAGTESQDELPNVTLPQSLAAAGSVARIRSSAGAAVVPGQGIDRSFTLPSTLQQQQPPPRQARSLPTAVSAPTDWAAVRSLSLPPWRKKHHSALQLGQHPPPSVSPSVASSARQEWLPQYAFQSQSSSQQQQQLPPLPPQSPATAATEMGVGPGPVPLDKVLTVSTNSIAESPSEELTDTLQKQPPVVESAPVSASGSTTTLPAVVQSLDIAGVPVSVGAFGPRSGSVVASEKAPGTLGAEEETVEVRPRGGVVSPTTGPTVVTPAPATLPRRTSRRSSTRKTRPMSLDNGQDSASLSSAKLLRTRTLSGTISSSWTAWKDHLLVLEEEEYVIEDSSESPSIASVSSDSEGSCSSDSEGEGSEDGRGGGGHDNDHEHEHEHDDHRSRRRKEKRPERRRRKDGQESVTPVTAGGGGDGRRTNKSSGTFGDLRALAAAIAASQQRQQQQTQQQGAGGSGAGGVA